MLFKRLSEMIAFSVMAHAGADLQACNHLNSDVVITFLFHFLHLLFNGFYLFLPSAKTKYKSSLFLRLLETLA
jgi:hypothetical protein